MSGFLAYLNGACYRALTGRSLGVRRELPDPNECKLGARITIRDAVYLGNAAKSYGPAVYECVEAASGTGHAWSRIG